MEILENLRVLSAWNPKRDKPKQTKTRHSTTHPQATRRKKTLTFLTRASATALCEQPALIRTTSVSNPPPAGTVQSRPRPLRGAPSGAVWPRWTRIRQRALLRRCVSQRPERGAVTWRTGLQRGAPLGARPRFRVVLRWGGQLHELAGRSLQSSFSLSARVGSGDARPCPPPSFTWAGDASTPFQRGSRPPRSCALRLRRPAHRPPLFPAWPCASSARR